MQFDRILCIADPMRQTRAFPEGFFDLLREPIRQGAGFDIGYPAGGERVHALRPGFCLDRFRTLTWLACDKNSDWQALWGKCYFELPDAALRYFLEHIPDQALLLCFEMPVWLTRACQQANIPYIDIRVSPLRFGRDLYIALRTNSALLYERINQASVCDDELRLEAGALAANVRMHRRRLEEAGQLDFALGRSLVFIGQAPYDASLLTEAGGPLRCEAFIEQIMDLRGDRTLIHKPHPFSPSFGETERSILQKYCDAPITTCHQSAYQLLTSSDDVELIGLSSGLLQEAAWFEKTAHTLYTHFVPLASTHTTQMDAFQQVPFADWCSPGFWHRILAPQQTPPKVDRLPLLSPHYGREMLDQWWDYSKVLTWNRSLPREAFLRAGGQALRDDLAKIESKIEALALAVNGL